MKIKGLLFALMFIGINTSFGQGKKLQPVKWSFESVHLEGNKYELVFTATIDDKWEVYSVYCKKGGPIPTSIQFDNASEFRPIGEIVEEGGRKEVHDKIFDMDLVKFSHKYIIKQKVEMMQDVGEIMGYVTFMTCDGVRCLPPDDITFIIELKK